MGLAGEGIIDPRVWIVKTHFPERYSKKSFAVDGVIVLVRNPFDCLDSYFNMAMTEEHTKSISLDVYVKHAKLWK